MRRILVACLAPLITSLALNAACLRSETKLKPAGTPATGSTPRAESSANPSDEDALAASILLTVEDFPAGWAEEPSDDNESPLDRCDPDETEKTGEAESGDFSDGSGVTISQNVAVFEDPSQVSESLALIEELAECYVDGINEGVLDNDEAEFSDASFSPLSFPSKGDQSRAFRLKFHVRAKGRSGLGSEADVYNDVVYAYVGRIGISVSAFDTFSAPRPSDWEEYVDIAVDRASRAAQ